MLLLLSFLAAVAVAQQSRCTENSTFISCTYNSAFMHGVGRNVLYQTPLTPPPPGGFPVVFLFQGSFFKSELFWFADKNKTLDKIFDAWAQTQVVKSLLDNGFACITPNAPDSLFWQTNIPPFDVDWFSSSDYQFMMEIFDNIQNSTTFGSLDFNHMFATGISSGGYMTSRVAVSLTKYFRAVAVESGSYMVCGGPACVVPGSIKCDVANENATLNMPLAHPPTLFMHGLIDPVVPYWSMLLYAKSLENQGTDHQVITCDTCDHQWIPSAPKHVLPWFQKYYSWEYTGNGQCPSNESPAVQTGKH